MTEVKPAMTFEQWAIATADPTRTWEFGQHAIAAAILHDQPFGFTWEMVDQLRQAGNDCGAMASPADECYAVADRIAALLPPRDL